MGLCLERLKENIRFLTTRVLGSCELPGMCQKPNLGPLEEQLFLAAELSIKSTYTLPTLSSPHPPMLLGIEPRAFTIQIRPGQTFCHCHIFQSLNYNLLTYKCFGYMYICAPCTCSTHEGLKRALDALELKLDGCELACECCEPSLGPLEEQPVLSTSERSLQPSELQFIQNTNISFERTFKEIFIKHRPSYLKL